MPANLTARYRRAEAAFRNAGVQYSREWISPYGGQTNDMMGGMSSMMRNFTNPMQNFMGGSEPRVDRHAQLYQQGTALEQARNQIVQARSRIEEIDTKRWWFSTRFTKRWSSAGRAMPRGSTVKGVASIERPDSGWRSTESAQIG